MNNTRYYSLLDLNKSDNPDQDKIKKSYRKLALKWHPDRNKDNKDIAEKNFKEISEAYQVLSNEDKKKIYDQYGEEAVKDGNHMKFNSMQGGIDPHIIFRHAFGKSDIFNQFGGHQFHFTTTNHFTNGFPKKNVDKLTFIKCSLEELFTGTTKKMKITETNGISRLIEIHIKKGWKEGTKIIYERPYGGKITFILKQLQHKWFIRSDNDLVWKCNISENQAKKGIKITIPMLNGDKLKFKIDSNQIPIGSSITKITGKGMPIKDTSDYGDLIINFNVKIDTA